MKGSGEENGRWGEEGISYHYKWIIVHLLVDYLIICRLTRMKGTLRNCRYTDICSILRGSPGSCPRCWCELTDGDSGWFHLPTSFQKVLIQSTLNHSVWISRFCALQSLWYSGPSPCFQWNLNCDCCLQLLVLFPLLVLNLQKDNVYKPRIHGGLQAHFSK